MVVDGEGDGGSFAEDEGEGLAEGGEVIFLDPEVVDGVWDGDGDAGVGGVKETGRGEPAGEGVGADVLTQMVGNVLPEDEKPVLGRHVSGDGNWEGELRGRGTGGAAWP